MDIPRFAWDSEEASERIVSGLPVVLLDCPLATSVSSSWTFEYLSEKMSPHFQCDVYVSNSSRFQYWDNSKNLNQYYFEPPTTKESLAFQDFVDISHSGEVCTANGTKASEVQNFHYLQQSMVQEMGPQIMQEYLKFPLEIALKFKLQGDWDTLSTNLLLCGKGGTVTPCHFDEQENLFAQIFGQKRVRLFHPDDWLKLYPWPLGHPCDRQTRIVLPQNPGTLEAENPEFVNWYPEFYSSEPTEYYTDLNAGEILYIPQYWFHQMEGVTDNISMSWWFKHTTKQIDPTRIDLSKVSFVAVRRNLEKLLTDMCLQQGSNAHNFFLAVAGGKVPIPTADGNGVPCTSLKPLLASDIAAAQNIHVDEKWIENVEQAVRFATLVLPQGEAPEFIRGLVAGRFSNIQLGNVAKMQDEPIQGGKGASKSY